MPTKGLYPFQWNWDSCLTALGQRHFDEARAWTEIETLLAHQWPDGMVPHIVFHRPDDGYFPGPDVWATNRPTPTSGITQPPVLGFVLLRLFSEARDKALARERAAALVPKADRWHRWFYANRDPQKVGLVAILHPWESGRDNSIDWDEALARVPTDGVEPYQRRDTQHVNAAERPTQAEYDRYLWLVQKFRSLGWDNAKLHEASAFKVVDPGFNAILIRSDEALAELADALGLDDIARPARGAGREGARRLRRAVERGGWAVPLLRPRRGHARQKPLRRRPSAGRRRPRRHRPPRRHHPPLAQQGRVRRAVARSGRRALRAAALLARALLAHRQPHARRRARALRPRDAAAEITADSLALIRKSGFAEYYDPTRRSRARRPTLHLDGGDGDGASRRLTWSGDCMRIFGFGAHPDDVEIFFFGTLAAARAGGAEICWAIATDGSKGGTAPPEELRRTRRTEAEAAAKLLGVTPVFLDGVDGELSGDRDAAAKVEKALAAFAPDLVITHAPNDYHPDHRVLSALVRDAARYKAPVAYTDTLMGVGFEPTLVVDIIEHFGLKKQAIGCHSSQRPLRFVDACETWNRFRALQCNAPQGYAEAFRFEPVYPFADVRGLFPAAPIPTPL